MPYKTHGFKFVSLALMLLTSSMCINNVAVAKKTQASQPNKFTPEDELQGFTVPEGFVVELVASEEHGIVNPIDISFDDAGRLWVQTASMYPMDLANDNGSWKDLLKLMSNKEQQLTNPEYRRLHDYYTGKIKGLDKILILEDLYKPQPAKVFADGLAIPQSVIPYKNGIFVVQGAQLFYLSDDNNDDKADSRETILDGFGFLDTHTMAHSLTRGPGGWIYFSHGALNKGLVTALRSGVEQRVDYQKIARFSVDGKKIELVSSGLNNVWGHALRGNGQWYGTEANDFGFSITPMENGTGFKGIGSDRLRPYQPWVTPLHEFRVGGTGISGLAFSDDIKGGFPEEWKDVGLLANPITNKINAVKIVRNADGSVAAEHLEDFLTSKDEWFRPVNLEFGPDGSLYIVDWYNKVVSHNEVSREHPDRDKSHGRIWRVRHRSQTQQTFTNFKTLDSKYLVEHLKSSGTTWAKRAAWHQIADRQATQLAPELITVIADASLHEQTRIVALWALESLAHYDRNLMVSLLKSAEPDLRREAVRALASMPISTVEFTHLLKPFIQDKNVMVRSQVLRSVEHFGKANADTIDLVVSFCLEDSADNKMGSGYERKFERYLARKALEQYVVELGLYLKSDLAKKQPRSNIAWAKKALTGNLTAKSFLAAWQDNPIKKITKDNIFQISQLLKDKQVFTTLASAFSNQANAEETVAAALTYREAIKSKEMNQALVPAIASLLQTENKMKAIQAAAIFNYLPAIPEAVSALDESSDKVLLLSALTLIAKKPAAHVDAVVKLFSQTKDADIKAQAFKILVLAEFPLAKQQIKSLFTELSVAQKHDLLSSLSSSKQGAKVVLDAYEQKLITADSIDIHTVNAVAAFVKNDAQIMALEKLVKNKAAADKKALDHKFEKYQEIVMQDIGQASKGESLFKSFCLSCHLVGSEGAGFAPALDGSAHRSNEGLLTAILDPNAAVEGSYYTYRVIKTDGSVIEGFREMHDETGVTLRFMGGGSYTIPQAEVQKAFFTNRSVMPNNLVDGLSKQQFANLIAFIKTLN
ncbi:PVC-type heme-binding CxxCH protein [Paraglaciecola sp. L3A3]|uniref:PVC-type heme-binding CxxCH protein n=1 Tax=Paraglaciecola sp. L3A3 TaxID=2686358 RepID=UPI00131EA2CE|nr:PVC-type heme-binding CxxCH protein [Paraglaciecola sp. L3A3]